MQAPSPRSISRSTPSATAFILPVSALVFRSQGLRVGTVTHDPNATETSPTSIPVTMGQDDGRTVQIITGLTQNDRVIQDPPDSLIEGEKVHVLTPEEIKTAGAK